MINKKKRKKKKKNKKKKQLQNQKRVKQIKQNLIIPAKKKYHLINPQKIKKYHSKKKLKI